MKRLFLFIFILSSFSLHSQWGQMLNGISIWSLAKDPSSSTVYAGSLGSSSAIYKTTNFGFNWVTVSPGNGQTVFGIAIDSLGKIFAANFSNGLMVSSNGGLNFTTLPISTFGGQNVQAVACGRYNYVYVGTNGGGLYRSTDNGLTWSLTSLTGTQVITIKPDKTNNSIIYAGTTATTPGVNGFYRSTDFGSTFSENLNPGINIYGIYQFDALTLLTVSTSTGGPVHRSTNGGLNWITSATGYICRGITGSIYTNSVNISGNNGVFLSTNGGFNFTNTGLTYSSTPILSHPALVYAGVSGATNGGVWRYQEPVGIQQISNEIPGSFSLSQNYPNPFNPSTTIQFSIPSLETTWRVVSLIIFDILGREITTLVNQSLTPGTYEVEWNSYNNPSGLYFYTLRAGDYFSVKKMVLLK